MTSPISGTISVCRKDKKGFQLEGSETWYSQFEPNPGFERGVAILFSYKTVEKGGKTFHNIVGSPEFPSPTPSSAGTGVSKSRPPWPIPSDSATQRAIMRQHAVTDAISFSIAALDDDDITHNAIIRTARIFEEYYSGDLDERELTEELLSVSPDSDS